MSVTVPSRRASNARARTRSAGIEDGFSAVELVVAMFLALIVCALSVPILVAVSQSTSASESSAQGSSHAGLAIEDLTIQVGSASEVCLPTAMTPSGPTVTSGFAVRVLTQAFGTPHWTQWMVNPSTGMLQEQQWLPSWHAGQAVPPWTTVAGPVLNSGPPFSLPTPVQGLPAMVAVSLTVADSGSGSSSGSFQSQTTIASLETPYAPASPPQPCSSTEGP